MQLSKEQMKDENVKRWSSEITGGETSGEFGTKSSMSRINHLDSVSTEYPEGKTVNN